MNRRGPVRAAIRHSQPLDEGHLFGIRAPGRDYRLHIGGHARWHLEMRDDPNGLEDALCAARWIEFLPEHGSGYVAPEDNAYVLRRVGNSGGRDGSAAAIQPGTRQIREICNDFLLPLAFRTGLR